MSKPEKTASSENQVDNLVSGADDPFEKMTEAVLKTEDWDCLLAWHEFVKYLNKLTAGLNTSLKEKID